MLAVSTSCRHAVASRDVVRPCGAGHPRGTLRRLQRGWWRAWSDATAHAAERASERALGTMPDPDDLPMGRGRADERDALQMSDYRCRSRAVASGLVKVVADLDGCGGDRVRGLAGFVGELDVVDGGVAAVGGQRALVGAAALGNSAGGPSVGVSQMCSPASRRLS